MKWLVNILFLMFMQGCTSYNDKNYMRAVFLFLSYSAADFTSSTKCVWLVPVAFEIMGQIVFIRTKNIHISALPPTVYSLQFPSQLIMLVFHLHIVLDCNSSSVRTLLSIITALWMQWWIFGFHAEWLLASQKGLCTIELVL
jgi:hypothetical protein